MVTNLNPAASPTDAMPVARRAELLRSLVSLASASANPQLEAYPPRLAAALLEQSEQSGDGKEANLSFNAANLLKKNIYPFYYLVSGHLLEVLRQAMRELENPAAGHHERGDALSLVSVRGNRTQGVAGQSGPSAGRAARRSVERARHAAGAADGARRHRAGRAPVPARAVRAGNR